MKKTTAKIQTSTDSTAPAKSRLHRKAPAPLALEQRLIFDADVAKSADTLAHADPAVTADTSAATADRDTSTDSDRDTSAIDTPVATPSADTSASGPREVVFIDTSVTDWHVIASNVKQDALVVLIDANRDGLTQIQSALAGFSNLDAVHIVGHGAEGSFTLGSQNYTASNLDARADTLSAIGASLSADGDILLYGCDVGKGLDGVSLLGQLAQATGADVAASTDDTGAAAAGGNWTLETSTGDIAASLFLRDTGVTDYAHRLSTVSLDGKSGWTAVMFGTAQDPQGDSQAKAADTDIVADVFHGSFYIAYDDNGTTDLSDDSLAFRLRVDNPSSQTSFNGVAVVGLDANNDGKYDLFIMVDGRNNGQVIRLMDPGVGANNSPSTTTIAPLPSGWLPNNGIYSFGPSNYSVVAVAEANDPHWNNDTDTGNEGVHDIFVSWRVPMADLIAVMAKASPVDGKTGEYGPRGATGITFSKTSTVSYTSFTLTQTSSINGDLNGVGPDYDKNAPLPSTDPMPVGDPVSAGPRIVVSTVMGDDIVNDSEDNGTTISGTAKFLNGESLYVTVTDGVTTVTSGIVTISAIDAENGTWSVSGLNLSGLAQGSLTVKAVVADPDGNVSTPDGVEGSRTIAHDSDHPAVTIGVLTTTTDGRPVLSGTTDLADGTLLTVTIDHDNNPLTSSIIYQVIANGGAWTLNLATAVPSSGSLPTGGLTPYAKVTVTGTDPSGNATTDTLLSLPAVNPRVTNDTTPAITGTWTNISGDELSVTVNGVTYTEGSDLVVTGNTWTLTIPPGNALVAGTTYLVEAVITRGTVTTDAAEADLEITTVPIVSIGIDGGDTVNGINPFPTLSGTSENSGGFVIVRLNPGNDSDLDDAVTYSVVPNGSGNWTLNLASAVPISGTVPVGGFIGVIGVRATDSTGGTADIQVLTISTPTVAIGAISSAASTSTIATVSNSGGGAAWLNQVESTNVTVSGTGTTGQVVTLVVTDVNGATVIVENISVTGGSWSATNLNLSDLDDGLLTFVATLDGTAIADSDTSVTLDQNEPLIINTTQSPIRATSGSTLKGTSDLPSGTVLTIGIWTNSAYTGGAAQTVTATVDASGNWSAVTTSNISNNSTAYFRVTAPASTADSAGNLVQKVEFSRLAQNSIGNSDRVILVNPVATDNIVEVGEISPSLAISGETNQLSSTVTVKIYQEGSLLYTKTATSGSSYTAGTSNWSLTLTTAEVQALSNGQFQVVAEVTDSSKGVVISDAELPTLVLARPTVDISDNTAGVATGPVTFTFTFSEPVTGFTDADITVTNGTKGAFSGSGTTYTLVVTPDSSEAGTLTVSVANNAATGSSTGRLSVDAEATQSFDTTGAAAAPAITINTSGLATDTLPVLTGTTSLPPGAPVLVEIDTDNDGDFDLSYSVTVQTGGSWSLDIETATPFSGSVPEDGLAPHSRVVATATNGYGISTTATGLNTPLVDSQSTNDTTPVITGTWTRVPGDILKVTVNGVTYTEGTNLVATDTAWTLTIPAGNALSTNGDYDVTTVVERGATTATDPSDDELVLDTVAPSVSIDSISTDSGVTGDFVTSDQTLVYHGSAEIGSVVVVTLKDASNASVFSYTFVATASTWSINRSALPSLAAGSYTLTATSTDAAGNTATATQAVVIDLTPPSITLTFNAKTSDTTPVISGITDLPAGSLITVYIDPDNDGDFSDQHTYTGVVVQSDGTWSVEAVTPLSGTVGVKAFGTDTTGLSTLTAVKTLQIVGTAPGVSINDLPSGSGQIYADTKVDSVEDDAVTLSGTTVNVADGSTVTVTITDGTTTLQFTTAVLTGGTWTLDPANLSALKNGTITVTAGVYDPTDDSTYSDTYSFIHDKLAGGDVSIDAISTDSGAPGDFVTNDNTLVYSGSATPGQTVTLVLKDSVNATVFSTAVTSTAAGAWTLDRTGFAGLSDGTYTLSATVGASTVTRAITVDTAAPAGPVTVTVNPLPTSDLTPTITGTATVAPGETLTVTVNGVTYAAGDGNLSLTGTNWTLQIPAENALSPRSASYVDNTDPTPDVGFSGIYQVVATIRDTAGNTLVDSNTGELTVADTVKPVVDLDPSDTGSLDRAVTSIGGALVSLDDNGDAATLVEASDSIRTLDITVGGLTNGTAEKLVFGSTTVSATGGSGTQNGITVGGVVVNVTYAGGVFTLQKGDYSNLTATEARAVLRDIQYQNTSGSLTPGVRTFAITATDDGGNVSDAATASVTVTNPDNTPPVIDGPSGSPGDATATQTIDENTTAVADLDADEAVTWSVTGGADSAKFTIDGDGNLAFLSAPDFESPTDAGDTALNNTYVVEITATDPSGNSSVQTITVTVENLDDNAITDLADVDADSNTVAENATTGTVVGLTALATDADSGATVSYSLSDDAGGRFTVDLNTGVVTVSNGTLLDYESATSHDITVLATSTDGSTQSRTFTIAITNLDDNAITDLADVNASANTVAENASTGTVVGITALATDADSGTSVTYTLSDDAGGRFAIDANTGVITVANASLLDYETATSHTVTVLATSSDGSTQSEDFTIQVTDVTEGGGDTTPPTIAITGDVSSLKAGETATVTFTLSEASVDFTESDISVSGGTLSNFSGSGTTYTATFTPDTDSTADGVISVDSTKFSDAAGNDNTTGDTLNLSIDTEIPTISISAIATDDVINAAEAAGTVAISGTTTGVEDGRTVTVTLDGNTYTTTVTSNAWSVTVPALDVAGLESSESVTADVSDAAGNPAVQATRSLAVDTVAPTPTISLDADITADDVVNTAEAAGSVTLTGSTTDVPDGTTVTLTVNGQTYTGTVTGNAFSIDVDGSDLAADTSIDASVSVTDSAGNTGSANDSEGYSVDTVAPTATIVLSDSALKVGDTATVTITFSEAVSGLAIGDFTVEGGALSNLATSDGGITWTATFAPTTDLEDTSNVITLAASTVTDAAGNANTASASSANYAIDTKAPTVVITDDESGTANVAGGDITYTFTFSEPVTGFTVDDITVANGTKGAFTAVSSTVYTLVVTPSSNFQGNLTVNVAANVALDAAGNNNSAATQNTQAVDTLRPTATIVLSDSALKVGDTATVTITFSEAVSGLAIGDFTVEGGALSNLATSDGGITWTATFTPTTDLEDASNVITLASSSVADSAGNANTASASSANYDIDTKAPTVVITDDESGTANIAGGDITYTFTFSEPVTGFTVDDITVANGTKGAFTAVSSTVYTLVVTPSSNFAGNLTVNVAANVALDAAGNNNSAATQNTQAVDTQAPVVTASQSFNYAENQSANAVVATVAATGSATAFRFTATGTATSSDGFYTIAANGQISITADGVAAGVAQNDFETTPNSFTYGIQAADAAGNWSASVNVSLNVTNLNDNNPAISDDSVSIAENPANGTAIYNFADAFTASDLDRDGNALTYTIVSGNPGANGGGNNGALDINASTGVISIADGTKLNYEAGATYSIVVQASDGTNTDTATLTLTLTNVNDNDPVLGNYTVSLAENSSNGTAVQTVAATDADGSLNALTYSITGGNTAGAFTIDSSTGAITVADSTKLDFETTTQFVLTVTASDGSRSDTGTVTVNLTNLNDNDPAISDATVSLAENSGNNTTVYNFADAFTSTDTDRDGAALTYSITGGNTSNAFKINASTGVVQVNTASAIDFETNPSFTLTVQASDGTRTDTATLTINLTNLNDNDPVLGNYTVSLAENSANGTAVQTVAATDADNNTLSYSITGGNTAGAFTINSSTGAITVADSTKLNYETVTQFVLTVTASDGTNTDTGTVTVNLTNLNDNPVSALTDSNVATNTVAENAANNTVVGVTALATDADSGASVSYSLTDDAGGRFKINATTGVISVANGTLLNYEAATSHTVTVLATSSDGSTNSGNFTIAVSNVNDNAITDLADVNVAANTVAENAANGTVVGITALATDADSGATVTYTLSDNAGGRFAINSSTGVVTVANGTLLNYEAATSHNVTVLATSSDSSTQSQVLTIAVTNLNDNDPVLGNYTVSLAENSSNGTAVQTVAATDADGSLNAITYSITGGNTSGAFTINSSTGAITVADSTKLDFETVTQFVLTVTASDGTRSDTGTVTVNLTNLNDNDPAISDVTVSLDENSSNNTAVHNFADAFTSTDNDRDGNAITYSILSGNDSGAFKINASTGAIQVNDRTQLDYESVQQFTLVVQASDGTRTDTATLTVNLTNLNDNDPVLGNYTVTIDENTANGTVVQTVAGTDADGSLNALTYSIQNGNSSGAFAIDANTGVITVADSTKLDYETTTQFNLTIRVSDGSRTDTGTVTINLTNLNDNAVTNLADSNVATNTVVENATVGTVVGLTAFASDADSGTTVTYELTDNAGGRFAINATTGVVTVAGALDYESATSHDVTVKATSTDGSSQSRTFTIAVTDYDEIPPAAPTVTPRITNDTTPTVSGTFDNTDSTIVSVVINGVTYTPGDGNLSVDGGTWTLTIPAGSELPENTYEIAVTAEDAVGNQSTDTSSTELVIDTTPPSLDITAPSFNYLTSPTTTVTFTFDEAVSDFDASDVATVGGDLSDFTQVDDHTWTATFTATSGAGTYSVTVADDTYTDLATNDGSGDNTAVIDASIKTVSFVDSFVGGIEYTTSTGLSGLTDADGNFDYRDGDTITFKIGNITLGQFSADVINGPYLFIQDIAGVGLNDLNSMYVENMAILLQLLDADGDASNGITLSSLLRDVADDVTAFNLADSDKQELADALDELRLLADFIPLFSADTELDADGLNVFETQAMAHVKATIEALAGTRLPASFDARTVDTINVPGAVISYDFTSGVISFTNADLLAGAVGQQVHTGNLVVSEVAVSAAFAGLGDFVNNGDGTYTFTLHEGVTPYDIENFSVDYSVQDWTVKTAVTSSGLDTNKSHLSYTLDTPLDDNGNVPEDVGYIQLTIKSALTFTEDKELTFSFTSERLSTELVQYAEFGDDFLIPFEYSNDGGSTWQLMSAFKITLAAGNDTLLVRVPVFDDASQERALELFDGTIKGDAFYDEKVTFNIADNDGPSEVPLMRIDFVYSVENQGTVNYTVRLDRPSDQIVTVDFDTQDFGAVAGVDYEATSGTLVFAPGETEKTITVTLNDDLTPEQLEFAIMNLRNATNAAIADMQGTLRIFDNDITPRTATVSAPVVTESASEIVFTIDLDEPFTSAALLDVGIETSMADGTYGEYQYSLNGGQTWDFFNPVANPGSTTAGHLIVQPGVTQILVRVAIDDPDLIPEANDTFKFTVSGNYAITGDADATALLRNDDGSAVTINPVTPDNILSFAESGQPFTPVTGSVIGDALPGDTVTIIVNGVTYTGTLGDDLTFSIDVATTDLLADPTIDASFTSTGPDEVERTFTAQREVVLDLAATTPTVDPYAGNDSTPTLTGSAELDEGETLAVTVNGITYTQGDGHLTVADGRWTLVIPPENALPEGRLSVTATVTDAVGNTATDTSSNELLIVITPPPPARDLPFGLVIPDPFGATGLPGYSPDWIPPVFDQDRSFSFGFNREDYKFLGLGRDYQQDIALTERGFKVIVIPADIPNLLLYRGVPDSYIESDNPFSFTIPVDAFVHTQTDAQVVLNATLIDGSALPDWLHFDRVTGTFDGVPPAGFIGELRVKVMARDSLGLQSEAVFRLFIGVKKESTSLPSRTGFTAQLRQFDYLPSSSHRLELASR